MFVVHAAGIHHHPDLPSGVDRVRVSNALETTGNILQIPHPSNIPFRVVAARARTRRGNGVRGFYEE